MWAYIFRRVLYNIPVYLGIVLLVMALLRVNDPIYAYLGKNPSYEQFEQLKSELGLRKTLLGDWRFFGRKWSNYDAGYGGSHHAKSRGKGAGTAKVSFDAGPGRYEVWATWPRTAGGTAWVSILDADRSLETVQIDQSLPEADADEAAETVSGPAEIVWHKLGTFSFATESAGLLIRDDSTGRVMVDAFSLRLPGSEEAVEIADDASDAVSFVDDPWRIDGFVKSLVDNQYFDFLGDIFTLRFDDRSWDQKRPVRDMIFDAIPPTMAITIPQLVITALLSIAAGLISAFYRGRWLDRGLVFAMVLGMSVSYLVYIILGQFFGAFWLSEKLGFELFAIEGYQAGVTNWFHYCALPVAIGVIVAMGYDTRFYRAVMVEESGKDYITTAVSKGVGKRRIMFVHMLKNAMIPIITRIMITLPFIITGSILLEMYFGIPGMGRTLINAVNSNDFPVIQAFAALFAAFFIVSLILTDVCYALVDPRVRLS